MMLFDIKSKFEYFNSIFIDTDNVNALIFIHFSLKFKLCDEVRDHFEVQDCN